MSLLPLHLLGGVRVSYPEVMGTPPPTMHWTDGSMVGYQPHTAWRSPRAAVELKERLGTAGGGGLVVAKGWVAPGSREESMGLQEDSHGWRIMSQSQE